MAHAQRIAATLAALAVVLTQGVPAAIAAGNGSKEDKGSVKQVAPKDVKQGTSAEGDAAEAAHGKAQKPETVSDPVLPEAGVTDQTTVNEAAPGHGKDADVKTEKVKEKDQAVDPEAGEPSDEEQETTDDLETVDDEEADEPDAEEGARKEHIAKVKAESRAQAREAREKGETGAYLVYVNGERLNLTPLARGGHTLVPFRVLSESLGAQVSWEPYTRTVMVTKGDTNVILPVGSTTASVNGEPVELQVPAEATEEGSTFVPLRFLAQALGADVDYDPETGAITVIALPEEPADEDTTDEGTTDESATDDGTTDEEATGEDATDEDATDEEATDEDATDEEATDEGTTGEDTTDEDTTDEDATDEGTTDEGITDDGTTDQSITDDGTTDDETTAE